MKAVFEEKKRKRIEKESKTKAIQKNKGICKKENCAKEKCTKKNVPERNLPKTKELKESRLQPETKEWKGRKKIFI